MDTSPLYLDWQFWSALGSVTAIVLSQLPPMKLWFRPSRLDLEVHSRVQITHKIGNPNLCLFVSINNSGGRTIQVRSIEIVLSRDSTMIASLPAQNYFENTASQTAILFVPFTLKPGDTWAHPAVFLNLFDRAREKLYRTSELALKKDIQKKINARPSDDKSAVVAEPELISPFISIFDKLFIWEPGEYVMELSLNTKPENSALSEKYRFTLYESDSLELKSHIDDYKFGGGISYDINSHAGVFIPITKHTN